MFPGLRTTRQRLDLLAVTSNKTQMTEVQENMKVRMFICLLLLSFAFVPSSLFAQAAEINPYAGFYWPGDNNGVGKFQNNQLLGVRGGGYITPNFELGGNWAWTNHFQPKSSNEAAALAGDLGFPQGRVRANIWEAEFTYNFGARKMFGSNVRPYLVGGAGGLTTKIKSDTESLRASCAQIGSESPCFVLNVNTFVVQNNNQQRVVHTANDVLESGDTFFTFSYGGGVKWQRVWGPMGFFGDFRGRTIPNFFNGHGTNWPELSAGLTFSWGER